MIKLYLCLYIYGFKDRKSTESIIWGILANIWTDLNQTLTDNHLWGSFQTVDHSKLFLGLVVWWNPSKSSEGLLPQLMPHDTFHCTHNHSSWPSPQLCSPLLSVSVTLSPCHTNHQLPSRDASHLGDSKLNIGDNALQRMIFMASLLHFKMEWGDGCHPYKWLLREDWPPAIVKI